jgi:hypothetical protein
VAITQRYLFLIISVLFFFNCNLHAQNNGTGKSNRYRFYQPGAWGYKDRTGKIVIAPQFAEANEFNDGWACVYTCVNGRDCKFSYIDTSGKVMLYLSQYDEAKDFSEGLAAVKIGFAWGYIDKTGKVVIKLQYEQVSNFSDGLACVSFGGGFGYIDHTGKMVIAPQFSLPGDFSGGLAHVRLNDEKWVYINKAGKIVTNQKFDKTIGFTNGPSRILVGGKIGYINNKGQIVISAQFNEAHDFSEGLACVKVGGKWGYINRAGKFVINPQFDTAEDFSDGIAAVTVVTSFPKRPDPPGHHSCGGGRWDTKYGYIDKTGNYLISSVQSIFAI